MKKYELTNEKRLRATPMYRIRAVRDFGDVKTGDLGGWVNSEENLSHDGLCWLYDEATALDHSRVLGNAQMQNHSLITDYATVCDNALIQDYTEISFRSRVFGNTILQRSSSVSGYAQVGGDVLLSNVHVTQNATIIGYDEIGIIGDILIGDYAYITNTNNYCISHAWDHRPQPIILYPKPEDMQTSHWEENVYMSWNSQCCTVADFYYNASQWLPRDDWYNAVRFIEDAKKTLSLKHAQPMYK